MFVLQSFFSRPNRKILRVCGQLNNLQKYNFIFKLSTCVNQIQHTNTYTRAREICSLKYVYLIILQQIEKRSLSDAYCFALGRMWFIVSRFIIYTGFPVHFSRCWFLILWTPRHHTLYLSGHITVDFNCVWQPHRNISAFARGQVLRCVRGLRVYAILVKNDFGFFFFFSFIFLKLHMALASPDELLHCANTVYKSSGCK